MAKAYSAASAYSRPAPMPGRTSAMFATSRTASTGLTDSRAPTAAAASIAARRRGGRVRVSTRIVAAAWRDRRNSAAARNAATAVVEVSSPSEASTNQSTGAKWDGEQSKKNDSTAAGGAAAAAGTETPTINLIVCDVDGTLLTSDQELTVRAEVAIARAAACGARPRQSFPPHLTTMS
jgi:hypothetical protein